MPPRQRINYISKINCMMHHILHFGCHNPSLREQFCIEINGKKDWYNPAPFAWHPNTFPNESHTLFFIEL